MTSVLNRLMGEGFRIFFLAAGVAAVLAMIVWTGWLTVHALGGMVSDMPFAMAPHHWHGHEMIFGYGAAAAAGFFLTAVPNWTGTPGARQATIAAAALVWLAGRTAVWMSGSLPPGLVAGIDLAFLPFLGAKIASQLIKRPKPQNMMFLALLALIWAGNLIVHLDWIGWPGGDAVSGLRLGLMGLCAMIAVLGGRITPAFTRNALIRAGREDHLPRQIARLDLAGSAAAIAVPVALLLRLPDAVTGAVALIAGALALARLSGWRGWVMRGDALVAMLHVAYALLGLGWVVWGLASLGLGSEVAALHLLAIGAVGGMTLAVMGRASLGHTGRPLVAPAPLVWASVMLPLAALLRWIGSVWFAAYYPAVIAAGVIWCLAFALFVAVYLPILTGPRLARQG